MITSRSIIKIILFFALTPVLFGKPAATADTSRTANVHPVPVVLSGDTLFSISANIGPFSPQQRVAAITGRLKDIISRELNPDSMVVKKVSGITNIQIGSIVIMSVTAADTANTGMTDTGLGYYFASLLQKGIRKNIELYSTRSLLINGGKALLFLIFIILLFWGMRKVFPLGYTKLERWEGKLFKPIKIRSQEVISAGAVSAFFIVLLKLIRLAVSLGVLYLFIVYTLSIFPWTSRLNVKPLLSGFLLAVLITAAGFTLLKAVNTFFNVLERKTDEWKGTLIKSVRVKTLELLSDERISEVLKFAIRVGRFFSLIILAYFYFTLLFSLFSFTRTWASTLFGYIIHPLGKVLISFINFLPNLFTIIVIIFVTRYVIKFIRFIFGEIERGTVTFAKFPPEWAEPTYKIVRFLIIIFSVIVIYPYLPGSESNIFKGVSIFLGILFSFGSTSAVSNVVSGVVLTYMRPFKLGDRVKIADTVGDVIEKTLLVTRVRTIKNVDITISNSMVLGSHIINFSSSSKQKGLILHTGVTIGYDAPWRKVHELLKSAAQATENVLQNPEPFVLQTALDDFFVRYELNAYTDKPYLMANIYSDLHKNIQDKFYEAGVEIMSPHYTSVRDGNKAGIPDEYLPPDYKPPEFKISPFGNILNKDREK